MISAFVIFRFIHIKLGVCLVLQTNMYTIYGSILSRFDLRYFTILQKKAYDGIFESYVLCIAAEIFDEKNISEDNFIVYCI